MNFKFHQLILSCLILTLCIYSATAAVSLKMVVPWDYTAYDTQQILETNLRNVVLSCSVEEGKPTHSRLIGGANLMEPLWYVRVELAQTFLDGCYKKLQEKFPNIGATSNDQSCFVQDLNPSLTGFQAGSGDCPYIFGAICSSTAWCATGSACNGKTCAYLPTLTTIDYQFNGVITAEDEASITTTVERVKILTKLLDDGIQNDACKTYVTTYEQIESPSGPSYIRVILASVSTLPAPCITLLSTLPVSDPVNPNDPIAVKTGTISGVDTTCFITDSHGFITALSIGGACSLSRPLGYSCTATEQCPGSDSTCDTYSTTGSICVLHDPSLYFATSTIHTLTYDASIIGSVTLHIADDFAAKFQNSACGTAIIAQSGSIVAVPGSIVKFQFIFVSNSGPNQPLPQACIDHLSTLNGVTTPDFKGITYTTNTYDATTGYPPFSCLGTRDRTVQRIISGGRCNWKTALQQRCTKNQDCDMTIGTECRAAQCFSPGLVPDATSLQIARVDIDANAYMGSTYGQQRLAAYVTKLSQLCTFSASLFNIGNLNYSRVHMWITPFNYTQCTQQIVQTAAQQASAVAISKNINLSQDEIYLQYNDLDTMVRNQDDIMTGAMELFQQLKLQDNANNEFISLNEEEEEPKPKPEPEPEPIPIDPASIIPRLSHAAVKTFSLQLPLTCEKEGKILCMFDDPSCNVPCAWQTSCTVDAQCGTFGICANSLCNQKGDPYLKVASASIVSIIGSVMIVIIGLILF